MRVLICGDRNWWRVQSIVDVLTILYLADPTAIVVEGGARGADKLAGEAWLKMTGYNYDQLEVYPADWQRYGKAAGVIRNQQQLNESLRKGQQDGHPLTCGVAFHRNLKTSRGTADMVYRLERAGIPVLKISK